MLDSDLLIKLEKQEENRRLNEVSNVVFFEKLLFCLSVGCLLVSSSFQIHNKNQSDKSLKIRKIPQVLGQSGKNEF